MSDALLLDFHVEHGAKFAQGAEHALVLNYGDATLEYRAVLNSAGITDRSARGKLKVTGSDRIKFLHGMLTNTVEGLVPGKGNYSAVTTPKGQTLVDLTVVHRGQEILLETEPGYQKKLKSSLDKFLIADDVTIEDVSDDFAILGIQGPMVNQVISNVAGRYPEEMGPYDSVELDLNDIPTMMIYHSYTGEPGYEIWVQRDVAGEVWRNLVESGAKPVGAEATEILRVEAGIPKYGLDIDERVMPLEAGIASAVDFSKGCFVGQEALAKMHNLGKPRRYLSGLLLDGNEPAGPDTPVVVDGKEIGWTTSSLRSIHNGDCVAMALIKRGFHEPGQKVGLANGNSAQVVTLPFRTTS